MRNFEFPESVKALIGELKSLPGVGPRSAERIAVWLLQNPKANPRTLAAASVTILLATIGFYAWWSKRRMFSR
jgi:recombinational DNA repair protein RecR